MTTYVVLWQLGTCYGNVMWVLPCVILIYRMKQISHTACILSTPFFNRHLHHHHHHHNHHHHHHHNHHHHHHHHHHLHHHHHHHHHHYHHHRHRVFYSLIISPWAVCNTPLPTLIEARSTTTAPSEARLSEVRVSISEWWNKTCQSCGSEARSKASCQLIANLNSLLPAKPYQPLTACSQWSHIHCYQLAPSEASFTPTSEARSTATSLLPAKPDGQRGESEHSTTTSLLPAKPDCQWSKSEHVRAVRPSMSEL